MAGGGIGRGGRNAASSVGLAGRTDFSGGAIGRAGATDDVSGRAALAPGNCSP